MIDAQQNPDLINEFLDYSTVILNKSPNTIKEYNYDLMNFFKFVKIHLKLTNEKEFSNISIKDVTIETIKRITLNDLHAYLAFLTQNKRC